MKTAVDEMMKARKADGLVPVVPECYSCQHAPAGNDKAGEYSAYCAECQPWEGKVGVGSNKTDRTQLELVKIRKAEAKKAKRAEGINWNAWIDGPDPKVSEREARKATAAGLIKHMALFYSDRSIIEDLDCVLEVCNSDESRKAVLAYAKARKAAPGFKINDVKGSKLVKSYKHNNHKMIPAPDGKACEVCGNNFTAKRSDARFCSPTCRQASKRGVRVTDNDDMAA